MKFQVERDVLTEAVGWASRALPSRPVIPVLSGLLLEAAADGLTLSCFDYEVSARVEVAAEVAEPGTVLVPACCWRRSPAACRASRSSSPTTRRGSP